MRTIALLLLAACASLKPAAVNDVATFVDPLIASKMAETKIPGAAFVYFKDGRVVYAKGYGFADVERKVPVSPETTIWRVGSISKVFTATALMQFGLDLDRSANSYLKSLQTDPRVTPRMLLDHTAGFDEIRPGTQAAAEKDVLPLAEFLRSRLQVVRTPGEVTSYSTYGMTLAGLMVEESCRKPYEQCLRERMWKPLGMTRTNITVPESLKRDLAVGYELKEGKLVPQPWEWYHTIPASSINSSALDMARFGIAHLEHDRRLLSDASFREMHRQQITMHPLLPGWCLGFIEDRVGQLRVIEHGGNMAGFSTLLVLLPETHEGFFLAAQFEGGHFRDEVKEAFLQHLHPAAAKARFPVPQPHPSDRVKALASHPAFDMKNPNRARALLHTFAMENPLHFHAADGSGYAWIAEQVVALDKLNPQVASRLARAFDRWKKYGEGRQAHARRALESIRSAPGLSGNVGEVVQRALA